MGINQGWGRLMWEPAHLRSCRAVGRTSPPGVDVPASSWQGGWFSPRRLCPVLHFLAGWPWARSWWCSPSSCTAQPAHHCSPSPFQGFSCKADLQVGVAALFLQLFWAELLTGKSLSAFLCSGWLSAQSRAESCWQRVWPRPAPRDTWKPP